MPRVEEVRVCCEATPGICPHQQWVSGQARGTLEEDDIV
jgi:hypothetical protein